MNTRRQDLEASWARTRKYLQSAYSELSESPVNGEQGGAVEQFREWLDHNELGLALDELDLLGEANAVSPAFWENLRQAATEMGLSDRAERYRKKTTG